MTPTQFYDVFFRETTKLDREVLFLRFCESYTLAQVAGILGISVSRSRKHCRRGVRKVIKNVLDAAPVETSCVAESCPAETVPEVLLDDDPTTDAPSTSFTESTLTEDAGDSKQAVFKLADFTSKQAAAWAVVANNYNPAYDGPAYHALTG